MSMLEEDLDGFDEGIEKVVNDNGMNISGGQRARVNLARCFYRENDIYLLDDPFSALDINVAGNIIETAII